MGTLLVAPAAFASEPSATELAIARRLFQEATLLEREGKWAPAATRLREATQIKDTPGLRFHLAHCEEKLGQLVEAMLDYDRARELIATGTRARDVESLLEPARSALEARLPTLLIAIPASVQGLSVELNGKPQSPSILGRPAPLNPGTYRLIVTAPGHERFESDLMIAEGDRKRVDVALSPVQEAPKRSVLRAGTERPVAAAPSSNSNAARTSVLVAESVVAIAGLGTGIGFLLRTQGTKQAVVEAQSALPENACSNGADDWHDQCALLQQAISDHNEARNEARLWSVVGFIGAGVGAAAFVLTATLWPGSESATRPRVTAVAGQDGAVFGLTGRF